MRFIERNKDRPFFLYVPHTMPHVPLFVSDKFKGKSERGLYGDVIAEIDWSVGQILEALKRDGLDDEHAGDLHLRQRPVAVATATTPARRARSAKARARRWRAACACRSSPAGPGKIPAGRATSTSRR